MDAPIQIKTNILIVDDDVLIAESTKYQLRKANYNIVGTAVSAKEAIEITKEKKTDIILMDINLKDPEDGIFAAEEIQKIVDVPFIFLTAYSDKDTVQRVKKIGPYGYLIKPYDNKELLVAIETSLYKHSFEKKIKEQELLFRTLSNFAYEWELWVMPDLTLKFCSPSCKRVTGYSADEFFSNPKLLMEIIHPEDKDEFANHFLQPFAGKENETIKTLEHKIITKQNQIKYLRHTCNPIYDDKNNYIGRRVTNVDITESKLAREELKANEEFLRRVINNIDEIIYSVSFVKNNFSSQVMFVSQQVRNIIGYDPEDFQNHPGLWFSIIHPEDSEMVAAKTKLMFESRKSEIRIYRMKHKTNGSYAWIEDHPQLLFDENNNIVGQFGTARDITERKEIEKSLKESEAKFRTIFQDSKAVMFLIDVNNNGKIIDANNAASDFYGYSKNDFISNLYLYNFNIDAKDEVNERMQRSIENVQNYLVLKHRLANGEIRDVDVYASVIDVLGKKYLFSIINDITDKKKIQKELEEYKAHLEDLVEERTLELKASTERFRHLAENSKDSIFRIDNKFIVQYMNEPMKRRWIIREGKNLLEVLDQKAASNYLKDLIVGSIQEAFDSKKTIRKQVFHTNKLWVDWVLIPEINVDNEVETILGYGRDITEIKLLQETIQAAFEKEKELNELKTNFISFASHEFRTPLTTIQTSADLLKLFGRKWSEEKYNKHFTQIETSIDEITHMLEQVLTISRVEREKYAFEPAKANLRFLIDEVIASINLLPYFNHVISVNYAIEREEFNIDTKLVKSILQNLISNAVKYSPIANRIELEVIQEGNSLRFEIEDYGIGIPESEINKIFEPFYRASNIGTIEGTGLGLAIVKQMVELHYGTISVQSKINEGTKFSVIINTKT